VIVVVIEIVRSIVGIGGKIGAIVMKEVRALLGSCVVLLSFDRMNDCREMNASVVGQIPVCVAVPEFHISVSSRFSPIIHFTSSLSIIVRIIGIDRWMVLALVCAHFADRITISSMFDPTCHLVLDSMAP
jgi:hypothetical protein